MVHPSWQGLERRNEHRSKCVSAPACASVCPVVRQTALIVPSTRCHGVSADIRRNRTRYSSATTAYCGSVEKIDKCSSKQSYVCDDSQSDLHYTGVKKDYLNFCMLTTSMTMLETSENYLTELLKVVEYVQTSPYSLIIRAIPCRCLSIVTHCADVRDCDILPSGLSLS